MTNGRSITPIFRELSPRRLDPWGSGILITLGDHSHWLVTAAHVMAAEDQTPLAVAADKLGYCYLSATDSVISTCELSPENVAEDPRDISFVQLSQYAVERLLAIGFCFLGAETVAYDVDENISLPCTLVGYPAGDGWAQMDNGVPLRMGQLHFDSVLIARKQVPLRRGLDPTYHFVARFGTPRNGNFSGGDKKLDPRGMSGGGIWIGPEDQRILIGVITSTRGVGSSLEIIGTGIGPVLNAMRRKAVGLPPNTSPGSR